MTKTAWYSDCYRRNLVDMHIDDWDERFLSEFDPQTYADNLKRAHIAAPMLYLQSHVGHCYFPTKAGHMHGALRGREDLMRQLVLLCQEAGMHVVGYYSLIYNTYEEDRHPEWRIRDAHGVSARQRGGRYGLCCPNNPEYFAFVMEQIAEMAAYFPTLDGMFYDMTFWPDVCHCPHCVEKYRAATGRDTLPAVDWNDPVWREFSDLRIRWMADFARAVTARTKSLWDGISVEHNYANAVASDTTMTASTEQINEQCDYTGGDLYGDLYNHSFTAKYFYGVTKHQPFEYMTCRCDRTLYAHTNSKAEETLAVEVMLTAAHHGASFIIDAIDPVGTLDARVYDRIGRVFARQMPYEAYFRGTMVSDAGVLYATTGRYNTTGQPFDSKKCSVSAVRTLIEAHIPVSVVSVAATADAQTQALPYLLAPQIAGLTDENRADLCRYVENGGTLYFSGAEEPQLLSALLGASLREYTRAPMVYLAPTEAGILYFGEFTEKYPLPVEVRIPILDGFDGCTVLARLTEPYTQPGDGAFASIHSNPPGIPTETPVLVTKTVGRGRVIWSAAPIEFDSRRSHKKLLLSLIFGDAPLRVRTDAPRQVELVTFAGEDEYLISAVDLLTTDELLPQRPFSVSVSVPSEPEAVIRLGGAESEDTSLPFAYKDGYVTFSTGEFTMFAMYRIVL